MESPVYEPREDSYLLAKAVEKYAYGRALEIGTGSGILAKTAAKSKKVKKVLAVDINPLALDYAKKNNHDKKITYQESDLFSNVKGKYDIIIFNPPYLPDDERIKDIALDGGKEGYELSVRFLKDAIKYLEADGQILFLLSSLTNKQVIDRTLIENAYLFEEIERQSMEDSEILYVYKIKKLESLVKGIKSPKFFSEGKRGLIYKADYNKKKVAIKIKNPKSAAPARIFIEGKNLAIANKIGIGPKLVNATSEYAMYEFAEGTLFPDFLKNCSKKEGIRVILKIFSQMRALDKNGFNKEEMTNPYKHIIVTPEKEAVLLDFERANKTLKPRNITQFCQYLASANMQRMLKAKKIDVDRKQLFLLAKEYKKNYDEKIYERIRGMINDASG